MFERVLIANRGEIAIRIARAAQRLGIESVGIYPAEDANCLHTQFCTQAVELTRLNGGVPVDAYLDIEQILKVAKEHKCDCIHPGYGFLSENANFASRCEEEGIKFIGPSSQVLRVFGDKVVARELAQGLDIGVVPGSSSSTEEVETAQKVAEEIGFPVILKAAAGGGGRGMRVVSSAAELAEEFARCSGEAKTAFGNGQIFVEKYLQEPRHIEVQVLADEEGQTVHLYERDCSIQLRHQKVIEIAPAPNLDSSLREDILAQAVRLVQEVGYSNAGTVEFLVDQDEQAFYFIECNPRIQVEHTVTEQVTGVDLIEAQFYIASGSTLSELGMDSQESIKTHPGFSVQARVSATGSGLMVSYREPSGPGVRVDACGYAGYAVSTQFDPLIAKVITTVSGSIEDAIQSSAQALAEFHVQGVPTNLASLEAIVSHEEVVAGRANTFLLSKEPSLASANGERSSSVLAFLDKSSGAEDLSIPAQASLASRPSLAAVPDTAPVVTPMESTVVSCEVLEGDRVRAGDAILVVNAMKMETVITAPVSGHIVLLQQLEKGDALAVNEIVARIQEEEVKDSQKFGQTSADGWVPTLDQVSRLQELAAERLAPGSEDPGVVRQRSRNKLTCRERIDLLLDEGTFHEIGSVAGFATYDEEGNIMDFTPANHVGGWGQVQDRLTIVCADDFTSRGGHADGAIGAKSGHLDRLSIEMRAPSVRLLDGSSGGGSVAAMVPKQKKEGESAAKESQGAIKAGRPRVSGGGGSYLPGHLGSAMFTEQLATVPVVNMLLGSVVGIGAAKAVLGHFSVMVRDISQLFVAGPPVVKHAMGYDITKEELGDWRIHCTNGSVDNLAETEEDAVEQVRQFLSYLPQSVYEPPPVIACSDPANRREEELLGIIPRKRTTTFDIRRAIKLMADRDSFFELGALWGSDQVTGFARFNGYPVGVIASDSRHVNGGALTAEGCRKLTRHLDICDLFHIPVLNLVDNPGFAVGLEHEIAGTIRAGGEWMVAFSQVSVPVFTVLMRRSFGVAGNNYATPRSRPSMRVTWPAADVGGIPPEGGIEAAYKRQLAEAEDPEALRAELNARIESARGPLGPLSRFQIEEMIDPRDTRRYICEWVELAYRLVSVPNQLDSRPLQFRP